MQPTFTELKKTARATLKSKWPEAVVLSMMLVALLSLNILMQYVLMGIFRVDEVWSPLSPTTIPHYSAIAGICITLFSVVYDVLICLPFAIGVIRWFWLVIRGESSTLSGAFYYFSSGKLFFKTVFLSVFLFVRAILGVIVCFAPYVLLSALTNPKVYNLFGYTMPVFVSGLFPIVTFASVVCSFLLLCWVTRYTLFFVPLFTEPQLSANAVISKAVKLSKGKLLRLVGFLLSFIGWILLSIFILPLIFVVPYMIASITAYGSEEMRFSKLQNSDEASVRPI